MFQIDYNKGYKSPDNTDIPKEEHLSLTFSLGMNKNNIYLAPLELQTTFDKSSLFALKVQPPGQQEKLMLDGGVQVKVLMLSELH